MKNINLVFIRGDTVNVEISSIEAADGSLYTLKSTDKVYIDVKRTEYSEVAVIHKEVTAADYTEYGALLIRFYPDETRVLDKGEYFYDVRLVMDSDNIYTIIPLSKLLVVNNITEIPGGYSV